MEAAALQRVVAEWLRGPALPELTPRELPPPRLEPPRPILAIAGPRRSGKTFYLLQLIERLLGSGKAVREDILFVDFEDYRLRDFAPEDMDRLLAAFHQLAGRPPRYLFFDEVHRLPYWSRVLRTLHNARKYALVVTGSNASMLSSRIASELRGRYEDVMVLPFSFREFLAHRRISWDEAMLSTPESGLVLKAFDEYLRWGGFPEVASSPDEREKKRLLQSYFETTYYRDVIDRCRIRARTLLDLLMRNILESYASLFSISAFGAQLKAGGLAGSKRSIADYLRFLEEAFFVATLEKFDYSPRKRMMNPKKVYLTDTGFAVLGGAFSENRGHLLENVVAVELLRRRAHAGYFKGEGECDFIIQKGTRPAEAWQVCWELGPRNEKRELKGLSEAMSVLGLKKPMILTYLQEGTRRVNGEQARVMPVWRWLLESSARSRR
jgi:hypothetical protein